MPAHEVETVEAARNQHINHRQPEILEGPSACVHGSGKGLSMGADTIWHDR